MTISPPSNVRLSPGEPARVLACGIDSLVLALDVHWLDERLLYKLAELKQEAAGNDAEVPGRIMLDDGSAAWLFTVKPHGTSGHAYLLNSGSMSWSVGHSPTPTSRPGVMVTIRSETLWTHGPASVVQRVHDLIDAAGGKVMACKVSRADLCVDVLLPVAAWDRELREYVVSRAEYRVPFFSKLRRTGLQIGKGKIMGRMYDKPLEIIARGGKKIWMYDVWGVQSVADDHRIIRVEFEAKREGIKALGVDTFEDLEQLTPNLWAYFTGQWLRMVDDPAKHHTRQKLLPWWPVVQAGYTGAQHAMPLIRAKAVKADREQLCKQLLGYLTSLVAADRQGDLIEPGEMLDLETHLAMVKDTVKEYGWNDAEFTERVKLRQARYQREGEKFAAAECARAQAGVSLFKRSQRRTHTGSNSA
ncbi:hypothetical protein ACERK3_05520 [Phycisphaerales bacterium AB-hyl4]|uniref:Replication initiation factor n=1 Tax=Natronomicrosphaera hydrolytica TaxID=3242702 RepID=A0ABV4U2E0_9BACT